MRILISTFGSLGDLHPYLALALEAKRRGHEPILATSARYREKIEAEGIACRPVRPDLPEESDFRAMAARVMDKKSGPEFLFKEVLMPPLRQSYADLLEAAADADCIITHPAAPAGPLAAQRLQKNWFGSVLAPMSLWSVFDPGVPPTMPQLDWLRNLGPLWGMVMRTYGRQLTRHWVQEVDELAHEEGLPTGHAIFEGQFSPHGNLALFSKHYASPQPDWPERTVATGFPFFDRSGYKEVTPSSELSDWRSWLEEGDKPVVATLGSAATFAAGGFWEKVRLSTLDPLSRDFPRLAYRALYISAGDEIVGGQDAISTSPYYQAEQELQLRYAPYSELFPSALCVVHQGGIGTTAQALRAGVPQIVVPFAQDQPDNAARIQRLGVGINGAELPGFAFAQVVANCQPRAARLGQKIRAENGAATACKQLEMWLRA